VWRIENFCFALLRPQLRVFWQTMRIGVVAATTAVEPSWLYI
jgi:hypothetical protein